MIKSFLVALAFVCVSATACVAGIKPDKAPCGAIGDVVRKLRADGVLCEQRVMAADGSARTNVIAISSSGTQRLLGAGIWAGGGYDIEPLVSRDGHEFVVVTLTHGHYIMQASDNFVVFVLNQFGEIVFSSYSTDPPVQIEGAADYPALMVTDGAHTFEELLEGEHNPSFFTFDDSGMVFREKLEDFKPVWDRVRVRPTDTDSSVEPN